jgi:hypothetical protein
VRALLVLIALLVAGCGAQSMAWHVDDNTTVAQLDERYRNAVAGLWQCADIEYDWLVDCPEYHRVWRRYWQARRELADLKGWK